MTWDTQPDPINGLPTSGYSFVPIVAVGAVDLTGTISSQATVDAAVAFAYANGDTLYWPDGIYLTTTSIPNFHDVRHRGPGVVKRGSDLFYVDPSLNSGATNTLYVATTGSDTNDGLSSSQPRLTAQATGNVIYTYTYGDVTWKLVFAAGTYQASTSFSKAFTTPNRVQFLGPAVSDGVAPTAIFDSPGGAAKYGIYFQNYIRAYVEDIAFTDYKDGVSPSGSGASNGIIADGRCELYTRNVWTDNCDTGISCDNGSQIRIQAGRHGFTTANAVDIDLIRQGQGSIGYNGTLADVTGATGTALLGGTNGIRCQEFSMVHADFCYNTGVTGVLVSSNSRVHSVSSTYSGCTVGIDARLNSVVGNTTNTFTGCTNDIIYRSGARSSGVTPTEATDFGPAIYQIDAVGGSTQSVTPVTLLTKVFEAKELQTRGAHFTLKLYGEVVGTADTKNITVTLGGTTLLNRTITASTTDYYIEVEMFDVTPASLQRYMTRVFENGVLPVIALVVSMAEDLTASKTLTVTHNVANAADTNRVQPIKLEICH